MRVCPNCQATVSDTANFCDNCGRPFRSNPVVPRSPGFSDAAPAVPSRGGADPQLEAGLCSACGYRNVPGEMFCQNCGVQLAPVASAPPPPPRPLTGPPDISGFPAPAAPQRSPEPSRASDGFCPECRAAVSPEDAFCPNCGVKLSQPGAEPKKDLSSVGKPADSARDSNAPAGLSAQQPPAQQPLPPLPLAPPVVQPDLVLIVKESGARLAAPQQVDIIIGRSDPVRGIYPDVDVTPAGGDTHGVSRKHARVFYREGQYYLEDLNSTNFTFLNRQKLLPGHPYPVKDGDELRVGLLALQIAIL